MADVFNFGIKPIVCHAWNHDRTQLALSANDNDVQIYKKSGKKWDLIHTLKEHTLNVTGWLIILFNFYSNLVYITITVCLEINTNSVHCLHTLLQGCVTKTFVY